MRRNLFIYRNLPRFSGEATPPAVDLTKPEIKAAIDAAVATATAGLKTNRDEILTEKKKAADDLAALQAQVAGLGDLAQAKVLLETFSKSEEAKLIAEGKIDQVLEKRTDTMRRDADSKVSAATKRVTELETEIVSRDNVISSLVIDSVVGDAFGKADCVGSARRDVLRAAREVFKINKEYKPEARDAAGTLLMGKDGKSPLTPGEWLASQREDNPHWWGTSSGGGAGGNSNGSGKGNRPDAERLKNASAQQLLEMAISGAK